MSPLSFALNSCVPSTPRAPPPVRSGAVRPHHCASRPLPAGLWPTSRFPLVSPLSSIPFCSFLSLRSQLLSLHLRQRPSSHSVLRRFAVRWHCVEKMSVHPPFLAPNFSSSAIAPLRRLRRDPSAPPHHPHASCSGCIRGCRCRSKCGCRLHLRMQKRCPCGCGCKSNVHANVDVDANALSVPMPCASAFCIYVRMQMWMWM